MNKFTDNAFLISGVCGLVFIIFGGWALGMTLILAAVVIAAWIWLTGI